MKSIILVSIPGFSIPIILMVLMAKLNSSGSPGFAFSGKVKNEFASQPISDDFCQERE